MTQPDTEEWYEKATERQLKRKCIIYDEVNSAQFIANRESARASALAHSPSPTVYMVKYGMVINTGPLVAGLLRKFDWKNL